MLKAQSLKPKCKAETLRPRTRITKIPNPENKKTQNPNTLVSNNLVQPRSISTNLNPKPNDPVTVLKEPIIGNTDPLTFPSVAHCYVGGGQQRPSGSHPLGSWSV